MIAPPSLALQLVMIVVAAVTRCSSAPLSARTENVTYRSIIGDRGMRWGSSKDEVGPRMQFLSRNLCAKAGPAEMSVLPSDNDTCRPPPPLAGTWPGRGEVKRINASDCCRACLAEWWCRAWTEPLAGVCSLKDNALPSRRVGNATLASAGVRRYMPAQVLPSPRYANCVVNGSQTITHGENAARAPADLDEEWFSVVKEKSLAARCEKKQDSPGASSSYHWSVMTTNGNGWANLGADAECLPQCYHSTDPQRPAGWPPAVNASASLCPNTGGVQAKSPVAAGAGGAGAVSLKSNDSGSAQRFSYFSNSPLGRTFSGNPMNQPKVLVELTQPDDPYLRGSFNWTFEYDANLAVPEHDFPSNQSWGKAEWWRDNETGIGHVRLYSQTSLMYPWTCTYFSADAGVGVKANQLYDGRGIMTETPHAPDFIVSYFLEVSEPAPATGMYAPNMVACWNVDTGKACRPYDDTNAVVHQQILFNMGKDAGACGTPTNNMGCPKHHRFRNGTLVSRDDPRYPFDAYLGYCCPCDTCRNCGGGVACCDPFSSTNGQSIYQLGPSTEWSQWGFPVNSSDGWIGHPKKHELNVGGLLTQLVFACPPSEPIEIVSIQLGPEIANKSAQANFTVSDFDILVPA